MRLPCGLIKFSNNSRGLSLDYQEVKNYKDIGLSNKALIEAFSSNIDSSFIKLRGRNILLDTGSIGLAGTLNSTPSEGIDIVATESVKISNGSPDKTVASSLASGTDKDGLLGDILISAKDLLIENGGRVVSSTFGSASGSNIFINVVESVKLSGYSSVTSDNIGAIVNSSVGTGKAGDVTINAKNVNLSDGTTISSVTLNTGKGGNVNIHATDSIKISGVESINYRNSSLSSLSFGFGSSGDLIINTSKLIVDNGGAIGSTTVATGNAGNIFINALTSIEVTGIFSTSSIPIPSNISSSGWIMNDATRQFFGLSQELSGSSGGITIVTPNLYLNKGGTVTVSNYGSGNGGKISLSTDSIYLDKKASITAFTIAGEGGNILLQSQDLRLSEGSSITTDATGGIGNGGNITISTDTLTTLKGSNITAKAIQGRGGNIQITTQGLFRSPDSVFDASSRFGVDGDVNIQTLGIETENTIVPLVNNFIPTEQAIASSCLDRRNREQGTFVVTGSGGLPSSPFSGIQEWERTGELPLVSDSSSQQKRSLAANPNLVAASKWKTGDAIVEAQGIIQTADGRVLLGMSPESSNPMPAEKLVCQGN